jgi:prepilin-type N-terminal cleavage/methylation domain-containing protein
MFHSHKTSTCTARAKFARRGLTLTELMISIAVMGMIAVALGAFAMAVEQANEYTKGHGQATQNARVVLQRIRHHIESANATADYPGFVVFNDKVSGFEFPSVLVIWHPDGEPANPDGPPLYSELVIYCPSPIEPHKLLEVTFPNNNNATPPFASISSWKSRLAFLRAYATARRVELLTSLRTETVAANGRKLGCVRFQRRLLPSIEDWADYQDGTTNWEDLPWALGIYGSNSGLRQAWCQIELQLTSEEDAENSDGGTPVPFFGSAALNYELRK